MRRYLLTIVSLLALGVIARPADAQLSLGAQAAMLTALDDFSDEIALSGTFGLGGRVALTLPVLPIGAYGSGTYYFPSCGDIDCSYWSFSLGAKAGLPLVVVNPYITGGWQWRKLELDALDTDTENGAFVGLGVDFNLGVQLFLEGVWEFNDDIEDAPGVDTDPIVIKAGIMFR